MIYKCIKEGIFFFRPNRFIANVMVDGEMVLAHVKNTGRCKELLIQGATVFLQHHEKASRGTCWSLIGVRKMERLINIDSQAPNKVIHEWLIKEGLEGRIETIKPEFTYGESRIDFFVKTNTSKCLIEVKGVTLEENGVALFPDAPTERGIKHILELCKSLEDGYKAYIIFVIQMEGVSHFTPNVKTHKEFAEALAYAKEKGVQILALDCKVGADYISISNQVEILLK